MICNLASDISTKSTVWTVTDITTGRYIQGVPTHLVPQAMRQLELKRSA
jgi:hypothetical protein